MILLREKRKPLGGETKPVASLFCIGVKAKKGCDAEKAFSKGLSGFLKEYDFLRRDFHESSSSGR